MKEEIVLKNNQLRTILNYNIRKHLEQNIWMIR